MQLSSHNCPSDMRDELLRLGRTVASLAFDDSILDSGMVPLDVDLIGSLFDNVTLMVELG